MIISKKIIVVLDLIGIIGITWREKIVTIYFSIVKNNWKTIVIWINASIEVVTIMVINMDIILLIIVILVTIIDAYKTQSGTRDRTQPQTQDVKNWIIKTKH